MTTSRWSGSSGFSWTIPGELLDYLAEQLEIEDLSCVKSHGDREKTPFEHVWETLVDLSIETSIPLCEAASRVLYQRVSPLPTP